jgi:hypothetical protein
LVDAGGIVGEALLQAGGSGVGVEEVLADSDADQDTAQGRDSVKDEGATRAGGVPVQAGECGVGPP